MRREKRRREIHTRRDGSKRREVQGKKKREEGRCEYYGMETKKKGGRKDKNIS